MKRKIIKKILLILSISIIAIGLGILLLLVSGRFTLRTKEALPVFSYARKHYLYNEGTINILLLGIDCEEELAKETDFSNWNAGQADTIFLVSCNLKENKVSVIGIPRNSMILLEIYDENGECRQRINNQICLQYGYAGGGEHGLQKMKEVVSKLFYNVPIHGCVAASFGSLEAVMKEIGGVDVIVPDEMLCRFWDYATKGSTFHVDETNIISYLRYRDITMLGSPTIRMERQKDFLKTLATTGIRLLKEDPGIAIRIYKSIQPYFDTDMSLNELAYLAYTVSRMNIDFENFYQLPGTDKAVEFINENGERDFYNDFYLNGGELKRIMTIVFYNEIVENHEKKESED